MVHFVARGKQYVIEEWTLCDGWVAIEACVEHDGTEHLVSYDSRAEACRALKTFDDDVYRYRVAELTEDTNPRDGLTTPTLLQEEVRKMANSP